VRPTRFGQPPAVQLSNHSRILSGNISFGSGNTDEQRNIDGFWVIGLVTPGTPNTQFAVPYTLNLANGKPGRVAIAFDVKRTNAACNIYDSGTAWTATQIFLKCDTASVTVSLFIH
jgi:hypothetical protein